MLVAAGFRRNSIRLPQALVHQVLSGDPDPCRLLGGVVAVEPRRRAVRLSGGSYPNAVGSGPDELPPNAKSYNESAVPSYRVSAARGGNRHASPDHAPNRPVQLPRPGRTSATGQAAVDVCSCQMPRTEAHAARPSHSKR